MHLKLKLIYANIGNRALILSKTSSIIIRDRVAKTKEDLAEKNYEVDARYEWALAGEGNLKEWDHPDEYDVIIAPGESFETTDEIRLPLISVTVRKEKIKELTDGEHYLQIVVSPWQSPPKGETLRERWKKYGDFWYESITSEPMLINVEKPKKVHRCSNG